MSGRLLLNNTEGKWLCTLMSSSLPRPSEKDTKNCAFGDMTIIVIIIKAVFSKTVVNFSFSSLQNWGNNNDLYFLGVVC